jgi:hypothetical protein
MGNELAKVESGALARPQEAPSVGHMLQAVIEKGVTSENVAAIEKLVGLYERMEDRNAEKQFAQAFVDLQAEMRGVKAMKPVPNNDGTVRYTFAPFEEIMEEVGPRLKAHGFIVTFSTDFADGRLVKSCTLQHIGGHSKTNKFAVRIGKGPPGSSESQQDGAASTYAKRFALCDALNIVIEKDNDARAEGGAVTKEQADELERRIKMVNGDVEKFLKVAGAAKFAEIPSSKYAMLDQMLAKKEGRA